MGYVPRSGRTLVPTAAAAAALLFLLSIEGHTTVAHASAMTAAIDSYSAAAINDGNNNKTILPPESDSSSRAALHGTERGKTGGRRANARRRLDSKKGSTTTAVQPHRKHHGGGGKHGAGPDGHHALRKADKSGKAVVDAYQAVVEVDVATADEDAGAGAGAVDADVDVDVDVDVEDPDEDNDIGIAVSADGATVVATEPANESIAHQILESYGGHTGHHISKAAKGAKDETGAHVTNTAATNDIAAVGGTTHAKSGKEDHHAVGKGGHNGEAKSGKSSATPAVVHHPSTLPSDDSPTADHSASAGKAGKVTHGTGAVHGGAKGGKAGHHVAATKGESSGDNHHHHHAKTDKDPEAKAFKGSPVAPKQDGKEKGGTEVKGSVKPKAGKPITEWFIKGRPEEGDHKTGGKTGKSGKGSGGKGGSGAGHSGKSDGSGGGDGGQGSKSAKSVMSIDTDATASSPAAPTTTEDPANAPVTIPPVSSSVEAPTVSPVPGGTTDPNDAVAPTAPANGAVPTMPTDLLTMEPTPSPVVVTDEDGEEEALNGTVPEVVVDENRVPPATTDDPNSRWYPFENDDGTRYCEYGPDHADLPDSFKFETEEACCREFPELCSIVRSRWYPFEDEDGTRYCEYGPDHANLPDNFKFETREGCCGEFPDLCAPGPDEIERSPPAPVRDDFDNDEGGEDNENEDGETHYPTYSPTGLPTAVGGSIQTVLDVQGSSDATLEPFRLEYRADDDVAEPAWDEGIVTNVTMRHLVHSFRNCENVHDASVCARSWQLDALDLMVLERGGGPQLRRLMRDGASGSSTQQADEADSHMVASRYLAQQQQQQQHPVFELIFGGVMHFPEGAGTPTVEDTEKIVMASFTGDRLDYYIELLREEGMDVEVARLDDGLTPNFGSEFTNERNADGFSWTGLLVGVSCAFGGVGLLAAGSRHYYKRREARIAVDGLDLDMEKGARAGGYGDLVRDYAIRLRYSNDEIEAFPGSTTVAETMATQDQLSVPSLVQGDDEEEIDFAPTPGGTGGSHSSRSSSHQISPLESPRGLKSVPEEEASRASSASSTRYISVFTVKKDCGGKTLDQVDLRALAIAYLSRMLKKFPNTHLLPYDKNDATVLPAITNIRNIPDDIEELRRYVGDARLDDRTGKVLFNLRVESDEPVSKMKGGSGRGKNKFKAKPHTAAPVVEQPPAPISPSDQLDGDVAQEGGDVPKSQTSSKSPGMMEDVEL